MSMLPRLKPYNARAHLANQEVSRFGNYIGEAESDEEQQDQVPQAFKFDEAFEDEEEEEEEVVVSDQQLMEVDGTFALPRIHSPS